MRRFLLLAFRNVFRNRRRTLMTLLVVAGGVVALMLAGGFFSYMFWGLRETTIQNGLGHLQVFNADHFRLEEARTLENGLDDFPAIARAAKRIKNVRGVAPRIEFYGMVSNGMKSSTFMATAVDPQAEREMGFAPNITEGAGFSPPTARPAHEALVGAGLARSMNVHPGDGLTLLAVTADGALNGLDIEVTGIITSGIKEYDDRMLQVTLPAAQQLLQSERVTKLVVGLDRTEETAAAHVALRAELAGVPGEFTVREWSELATFYGQVKLMFTGIFVFLGVIVFFMVVMSSANTLLMAMFERTREIGTMLAMGTPRAWIAALFLLEGVVVGLLGALSGVLAGNGLGMLLNRARIELPPPPGNTVGWTFQVLHEPGLMIGASVLVLCTLAAASLVPAWRASRLNIVESLAHV